MCEAYELYLFFLSTLQFPQKSLSIIWFWIDCINYFVHRHNRIADSMKAEGLIKSVRFEYKYLFLKIINPVNSYISFLRLKLAVWYEQTLYFTSLKEMYPKFTKNRRVEISIGNKHVFCSDVHVLRRFEYYWQSIYQINDLKEIKKKSQRFWKVL